MALDTKTKELLNKFADSQVALNDRDKPRGSSEIQLGTLLDEAHGAVRSSSYLYSPAVDGLTSGEVYSLKGASIPTGAIITRAWIAVNSALTSPATGAVAIDLGGVELLASTDADSITGITPYSTAAATSGGKPTATIAAGNLDAVGQLLVTVEYIYPTS